MEKAAKVKSYENFEIESLREKEKVYVKKDSKKHRLKIKLLLLIVFALVLILIGVLFHCSTKPVGEQLGNGFTGSYQSGENKTGESLKIYRKIPTEKSQEVLKETTERPKVSVKPTTSTPLKKAATTTTTTKEKFTTTIPRTQGKATATTTTMQEKATITTKRIDTPVKEMTESTKEKETKILESTTEGTKKRLQTTTELHRNTRATSAKPKQVPAATEKIKDTKTQTTEATTETTAEEATETLEIRITEEFRRGKEGDEALTECNEKRGFCQCRSKKGVLLPGIGPRINCQNLTSCQREFMNDNPKSCDHDGRYLSKFCENNDDNSCFCINPDTGEKLSAVPQNYYKLNCPVDCPEGMTYHSCSGCEVTCHNRNNRMVCDQMCRSKCACPYGSFWSGKHQRCVSEEECQKAEAVSDTTKRAEKITEAPKPTAVSMSTTAAESQLSTKVTNRPAVRETTETFENKNVEEFRRGKEGDEALTECNEKRGFCQCRSKEGVLLPGIGPRINCQNLTSCQREFMSDDLKSCDHDGRYLSKFCENNDDNSCFCINPDTGEKLSAVPQNYYKLSCPDDCPEGMTYHSCSGCEVTCHNRNTRTVCDQMCRSKCACPYGSFWSGKYQRCVPEEQC